MKRWEMETHVHHCHRTPQPFFSSIFLVHPPHPPQSHSCPCRPLHLKPYSHSRFSCSSNNFPRWDSNAETFGPRNRNFNSSGSRRPKAEEQKRQEEEKEEEEEYGSKRRRWWSDEPPEIDEGSGAVWEEAISSIWIFEVFKSYGWTLPIIVGSLLLATGPKAFLMALALPLGQSALSLAFEKLWGRSESKPKRKYRTRRRARSMNDTRFEEEPKENQKARTGKTGYQTWVVEENNGSPDRGSREAPPSFGGWDDLERSRPTTRSSRVMDGSVRMPMEAGMLSRRERKSDTPLLLRLLIAVFPFLGTWTKML